MAKKRVRKPLRGIHGVTLDGAIMRKIADNVFSIRFSRKTRATAEKKLLPLYADPPL